MGKVIEILIKVVMRNHSYKFKNKTYKQRKGGAIGLRITGSVCRIVMDRLLRKLRIKLENVGLVVYLLCKFVDDVNTAIEAVTKGTRWGMINLCGRKNGKMRM